MAVFTLLLAIFLTIISTHGQATYTSKELSALKEFRPQVRKYLVRDFQKRDAYLLRYLRTHEFNMEKAVKSLTRVHNWRKDNDIDSILDEDLSKNFKDLPYKIDGFDREGNPLLRLYFGRWFIRKYGVAGKRETIVKVFRQMQEKLLQKIWDTSDRTGEDIDQFYFLVELQGFNGRDQLCLNCVPIILQFAAGYDAGVSVFVRNTTLINTPRIFLPALGLVKQLWTGSTLLKSFGIYDSDKDVWQPALLKDVAPEMLPKVLGGNRV